MPALIGSQGFDNRDGMVLTICRKPPPPNNSKDLTGMEVVYTLSVMLFVLVDPAYWTPKEAKPEDRGTPLIGRIRPSGKAEPDEDWQEEWGRHIPQRYGKGHDIYGLELDETGQSVVLRNIPVWEFREGMAAVYCWNGWEAEGWFGRVYLQTTKARLVTQNGERHDLDLVSVVRIGKATSQ